MDQTDLDIGYLLDVAKRRWPFLVVPFVLVFSCSVFVALWLQPVYSSSGTILIESQQIPDDLVRSTITTYADERIQVVQQLALTRQNLLQVIEKHDLLEGVRDQLTQSEQVGLIRSRIFIERVTGQAAGPGRRRPTTAFSVKYEDESPERALAVTSELLTLFLEENVRARTSRASETTEFFEEEAAKLQHKLEVIEEQIADYKQENSRALPEHLELHRGMLDRTESSIEDVDRDIRTAQDDLRFLEIELSAIRSGSTGSQDVGEFLTPEQQLANAQAEMARLQARYSALHPDVRQLRSRIERLQQEVDARAAGGNQGSLALDGQDIDSARVVARMDSMQERIRSLNEQKQRLIEERDRLESVIIQTPQVQRAMIALNRDYENTLQSYNEMQSNALQARLGETLEEERKAERFSLVEPPTLPDKPDRPNRNKVVAMGFILAVICSVGLVFALEFNDERLYGVGAFTRLLDQAPLAIIPYIETTEEVAYRKRRFGWIMAGCVSTTVVVFALVHFFVMPLDTVALKVMARLG